MERKAPENPELSKDRRSLPGTVESSIVRAAVSTASDNLELLGLSCTVLTSYVLFERGEAGASLFLSNISVSQKYIYISIALRNNRSRVAHTLPYAPNPAFSDSLINMLLVYDRFRLSISSTSKFY